MEVKGLKITGWKKAVSQSDNYGGRLFNNVYCNFKTGEVWMKEETQNSWTDYHNPDIMQVLSSPYKFEKMIVWENCRDSWEYVMSHEGR